MWLKIKQLGLRGFSRWFHLTRMYFVHLFEPQLKSDFAISAVGQSQENLKPRFQQMPLTMAEPGPGLCLKNGNPQKVAT